MSIMFNEIYIYIYIYIYVCVCMCVCVCVCVCVYIYYVQREVAQNFALVPTHTRWF